MSTAANEGKLYDRLEINPTDYAIKTFTPVFKEGQNTYYLLMLNERKIFFCYLFN